MDRRLTRQVNALNGDQFNFQPGRVHGVLLVFEGTNIGGQVGDLDDLGSVNINRDSRQIVNTRIADLGLFNDIRFGSNIFSSADGAAFQASVFIPFFESDRDDIPFQNALAIVDDSELNFEYVPGSGVASVFSSLNVSVYSELAAYEEIYEYRILRDDQVESAAVSGKPYQLNKNNVSGIYVQDVNDVVDLIQLEQSGRSVYSPQSWLALLAGTLRDSKLETTTFSMVALETYSAGNRASAANRDSVLTITTSGAGTLRVLTTSIHFWRNN